MLLFTIGRQVLTKNMLINLNTYHVVVQLFNQIAKTREEMCLNTFYVSVQLFIEHY